MEPPLPEGRIVAPTDIGLRQHPGLNAVLLYWLAKGHAEYRKEGDGMLIPWAMLSIGLLSAEDLHEFLPEKKRKIANWVSDDHARAWRGHSRDIILAWRDTFWQASAQGIHAGILEVRNGRVHAVGKLRNNEPGPWAAKVRDLALAVGRTIGAEQDDLRVATALGVELTT